MAKYIPVDFAPIVYKDWWEILKTFTDRQKADFLMAIALYPNYEPKDAPLWSFFKTQLEKQYNAYMRRRESSRENRSKVDSTNCKQENNQLTTVDNGRLLSTTVDHGGEPEPEPEPEPITTTSSVSDTFDHVNDELAESVPDSSQAEPELLAEEKPKNNPQVPYQEIVDLYNSMCVPGCIKCRMLNANRRTLIRQRTDDLIAYWEGNLSSKQDILECFRRLFQRVSKSDFLMGRTPKGQGHENWKVDLAWILKAENCAKLIEEKYR